MATKQASEAARLLARRSVKARRELWGDEFAAKLRAWGKLGGRPPKDAAKEKQS